MEGSGVMNQKVNKKHEILKASMKIFALKGYHNTKIEDIAIEAGIGKGTVYQYFESKIQLFEEMVLYYIESYKEEIVEIIDENISLEEKLLKVANKNSKHVAEHFDMAEKIDVRENIISNEMKSKMLRKKEEIFSILECAIDQAIENGEVRNDLDKEVVISTFFGAVNVYCAGRYQRNNTMKAYVDPTPVVMFLMRALNK
ncbi:TetR/AcrR family transcriptional regulator [Anaerosolibacter carboniphilus]|nr:TetR/AcrR family transcriptional regulator [Anaerosolibacter carboniphilus]